MEHYKTSIEIDQPTAIVFNAISKRLDSWWGIQDQMIDRNGITFKVSWNVPWYQFKVNRYIENHEMSWTCTDAHQIIYGLDNVQKEWVGTSIHWRLNSQRGETTLLEFEHEGLVPDFTCFRFCSDSWDHFIQESLISYLNRCSRMDSYI